MLRDLRQCTDEDAKNIVLLAEPCDDVDIIEEVALDFLRDLEDGEWESRRCWRCWRRHCQVKEGGRRNAANMQLNLCVSDDVYLKRTSPEDVNAVGKVIRLNERTFNIKRLGVSGLTDCCNGSLIIWNASKKREIYSAYQSDVASSSWSK